MYFDVVLSEYGYYTLANIPTEDELSLYYANDYYQSAGSKNTKSYAKCYSDEEIKFFNAKLMQKKLLIEKYLKRNKNKYSFIDIGCGEGFAVKYFASNGYDVIGLDYSIFGIEQNNPEIKEKIFCGDVVKSMKILIKNQKKFDVVNMDNVLEHVVNPKLLLELCHDLLKDEGVLVIKVPNDFSYLQEYFIEKKIIKKPYWICIPDHISYFNKDSLISICEATGFVNRRILSNSLIEFNLLNPNTHYQEHPEVGKSCHFARIEQENIFNDISPEKTNELYSILGEMGLGREIIGVFQKKN